MSSETTALLRSIRQWIRVGVFLLGIGVLILAHTGYILALSGVYWVNLVFSIAGVLGGIVAGIAGLKILSSYSFSGFGSQPTDSSE